VVNKASFSNHENNERVNYNVKDANFYTDNPYSYRCHRNNALNYEVKYNDSLLSVCICVYLWTKVSITMVNGNEWLVFS